MNYRQQLQLLIKEARMMRRTNYTVDSWESMQTALNNAVLVRNNPDALAGVISEQYSLLRGAVGALELMPNLPPGAGRAPLRVYKNPDIRVRWENPLTTTDSWFNMGQINIGNSDIGYSSKVLLPANETDEIQRHNFIVYANGERTTHVIEARVHPPNSYTAYREITSVTSTQYDLSSDGGPITININFGSNEHSNENVTPPTPPPLIPGYNIRAHTQPNPSNLNGLRNIRFGNGVYIGQARTNGASNHLIRSTDALNWEIITVVQGGIVDILFVNDTFYVLTSRECLISTDGGVNWMNNPLPEGSYGSLAFGNGIFVAVGSSGTNPASNRIATSPDCINWTAQQVPATSNARWHSVEFGNGIFLAIGNGVNADHRCMTSPDGINWTTHPTPSQLSTGGNLGVGSVLEFAHGGFFTGGRNIRRTVNGIQWTVTSMGSEANPSSRVRFSGRELIVFENFVRIINPDGSLNTLLGLDGSGLRECAFNGTETIMFQNNAGDIVKLIYVPN